MINKYVIYKNIRNKYVFYKNITLFELFYQNTFFKLFIKILQFKNFL
ncbi:hypothetical protein M153_220006312 [Pseudoloma neurophilia]|uniref:Uncharacterized protein n=1 Tax=Pseudoloma neurophilia TaxID=146866 RepID=A0A0R0M123_9MICR|nr:hypothetical protein M153_220006312 [Pseudoloma neurophilia]